MRSALCRVRLRRDAIELRGSLRWQRVAASAASVPAVHRVAFGVALALLGLRRTTRVVALAGRATLVVGMVRTALAWWRARKPTVRQRTDPDRQGA